MDDSKLIKKCQVGDKGAFQELISKYHPFVYKFLIKITQDEEIAEDITQETFLKVIKNIEKFDVYGKAKFSTYIITVSKNCYIDYLRKEKKFLQRISIDEAINTENVNAKVESLVIDKIYAEAIIKELENLSEEQKLVIKMKYIEGLTLKEIGEKLELEPKTVKSRIHNGMVKLRKIFKRGDKCEGDK
ncbi:RNA polymerase sigma factor [Clostridium sp. WILCCON 0269]|uniref:RNA polymerase sigma factor n=1 Tax=Candidatus Clostridium eludens TaxID=3381663 RepID=A0ABW8SVF9_9CLOT